MPGDSQKRLLRRLPNWSIAEHKSCLLQKLHLVLESGVQSSPSNNAIRMDSVRHGIRDNNLPLLSKNTIDDGGASSAIPLSLTCDGTSVVLPRMVRTCPERSRNVSAGPSLLTDKFMRVFPAVSDMIRKTEPALSV